MNPPQKKMGTRTHTHTLLFTGGSSSKWLRGAVLVVYFYPKGQGAPSKNRTHPNGCACFGTQKTKKKGICGTSCCFFVPKTVVKENKKENLRVGGSPLFCAANPNQIHIGPSLGGLGWGCGVRCLGFWGLGFRWGSVFGLLGGLVEADVLVAHYLRCAKSVVFARTHCNIFCR